MWTVFEMVCFVWPVVYNDRGHGPDIAVPGQVQLLGKVVDTPVVYNDRGHGPDSVLDSAVLVGRLHARCCANDRAWFRQWRKLWFRFCSLTTWWLSSLSTDTGTQKWLRRPWRLHSCSSWFSGAENCGFSAVAVPRQGGGRPLRAGRADSQVQVWRRQSSPTVAAVEKSVEIPHVFLDNVVDTPVFVNDRGYGPDVQFLDKVIDVPVAMQRHVPMVFEVVLTVQFLDKVTDVSVAVQRRVSMVLETLLFSDKGADVPVLCTTGAYGSRRSENVWRCRRCSSAWLGVL